MDKKVVLVTGIGGNVGQGILRNIRDFDKSVRIIGTNIKFFSAGNHLCDHVYETPYAYNEKYTSIIKNIIKKEGIDLIIPATDYEGFYLAKYRNEIPCNLAISSYKTMSIYLDKYLSFLHHKEHKISFATSYLPSEYKGDFENSIAKPRKGRGSRGLLVNPKDWNHLCDNEYMIQEYHKGSEITIAFYVTQNSKLHGFIVFERSLENGATHECLVRKDLDHLVNPLLKQIIEASDIRGSANVQAILDKEGIISVFEINCRISGTNSIRHNFGFKDVIYTLQEYLYEESPSLPKVSGGSAIRIMMDVIYPESEDKTPNINSNFFIY